MKPDVPAFNDGRGRRSRKLRRSIAVTCCLGVAALGGCKEAVPLPTAPLLVKVKQVRTVPYTPKLVLTGEILARVQSDLSFRVGGRVIERKVEVGAHVEAGQELARLDAKVLQADVDAATATVQAADAKLRQVAANFDRQKALLEPGFTTRRDYDKAEQERRSAEAMLASAEAQLATARDQLGQTVLRAPAAGTITARFMEVGQVAQASQPAFGLAQDGPRDAVVNVQETALSAGITEGIEIALVSDPAIKAEGDVREVAPAINATGAVRVKLGLAHPPSEMVLGAAVRVTAKAKPRGMTVLPWSALYSQAGRPSVWTIDPETKVAAIRHVVIEAYGNSDIVVRDGLNPGDLVVTVGTQFLRPGQTVTFTEDQS